MGIPHGDGHFNTAKNDTLTFKSSNVHVQQKVARPIGEKQISCTPKQSSEKAPPFDDKGRTRGR